MRFLFTILSVFVVSTIAVPNPGANDLSINTPAALVQCQPVQISWTAKHRPVFVGFSVISVEDPTGPLLVEFGWQKGHTLTWSKVNVTAETSVALTVRDSAGAVRYSGAVTVQKGPDSSCLHGHSF
ncbi:hypothetical protein FRC12_020851 [Ceratobasidium sp. 428]|nr:hypothetical protein FRC12_020851 [Ceratobasidium sp. 428]